MNLRTRYISGPVIYCLVVAVVITLFFELWRLFLLIRMHGAASAVPWSVLLESFLVGLRFDFSISSSIMLAMSLLAVLPRIDIMKSPIARRIHTSLTVLIVAGAFLIHLVDIEFFAYFNTRLNGMGMLWRDTPGMIWSMVWNMYPVIRYFLLYLAIVAAFVFVLLRLQRLLLDRRNVSPFWINFLYVVPTLAVFFVGARGRLEEKTTLRWGMAYFCEYDLANQLALNPVYTFIYDAIYIADSKEDLKSFVNEFARPDADLVVRQLLGIPVKDSSEFKTKICRQVTFDPPAENPPDVIIIIMESFGATKIDVMDNLFKVTLSPCFDSLAREGILFTNMYSEGMHTYSGIFSTLFGYPHLLGKLLMKQPRGEFQLWGLPAIFRQQGYETVFALTHDPHFDNVQGFAMSNGFKRVISALSFPSDSQLTTWGVPDHIMFDRMIGEVHQLGGKRFFLTLLTTSNHGPWTVPDVPFERVPSGTPDETMLNAFKYSDWALGRFVRTMERDSAFANTIVLIGADNGAGGQNRNDMDLSFYHMPLLILDMRGKLEKGRRIGELASQMDIPATVMGLVRRDYDDYTFGRNLLDSTSPATRFAFMSEWYRIGYLEGDYFFVARMRGRGPETLYKLPDLSTDVAALHPDVLRDYQKKALSIFQAGYYNLFRPLERDPNRQTRIPDGR